MTEKLKSNVQPPVIVIDSFEDVNESGTDGAATMNEANQNSDENAYELNHSDEPPKEDNIDKDSENCDNANANSSSRTTSLSKPHVTLQVPAPLQVPVKSSINIADSVTSETDAASSNVVSADGPSSTDQRTGHVFINFNRKENGVLKSLSRHNSRETLREEELKHLKEEVCIMFRYLMRIIV